MNLKVTTHLPRLSSHFSPSSAINRSVVVQVRGRGSWASPPFPPFIDLQQSSRTHNGIWVLGGNRITVLGKAGSQIAMELSMATRATEVYLVLMEYDPEYERLKADRTTTAKLETYVSSKHDTLLEKTLEAGSYKKRFSWLIIDGFAAEMAPHQAEILRSAEGVRIVEKDKEFKVS